MLHTLAYRQVLQPGAVGKGRIADAHHVLVAYLHGSDILVSGESAGVDANHFILHTVDEERGRHVDNGYSGCGTVQFGRFLLFIDLVAHKVVGNIRLCPCACGGQEDND